MVETAAGRGRGRPAQGQSPVSDSEILERALRAFAMYGYDGVSLRTLTRELGVSHGLITQRFGTKEALWYAAVDHAFAPFMATLGAELHADADPLSQARALLRSFAVLSARNPDVMRLVNGEGAIPGKRLDYIVENLIAPIRDQFLPSYRELVVRGVIRRIPDPTLFFMATCGVAAMHSNDALTSKLFGAEVLEPAADEVHADAVADLILEGLLLRRA